MEKATTQYHMPTLLESVEEQSRNDIAAATMAKCTKACFLSLRENKLLPTEEKCMRNCFVKSGEFNLYFQRELSYFLRNQQQ